MKRILAFFLSLVFFAVFYSVYSNVIVQQNTKLYSDAIASDYGDVVKNQGLFLQKQGINRENNLMMFGSSELGTTDLEQNPVNYFPNQNGRFIVNVVGRGYCQDLQHSINFGALSNDLSGKKVVFIISMQWFLSETGISNENFAMNFSPVQLYSFMFNKSIGENEKMYAAKRIGTLASENKSYKIDALFCRLYSRDSIVKKVLYYALKPYYMMRYEALKAKDYINANKVIKKYQTAGDKQNKFTSLGARVLSLPLELKKAEEQGKKEAGGNDYHIKDSYFDQYYRNDLAKLKNVSTGAKPTVSQEYDDLKLLLDISKEQNINPLFIIMPVNGPWYDYIGINEDVRQAYYSKVSSLIESYGFQAADYSVHEYEPYLMQDGMHLGWKGWLYVNETITNFVK